MIYIRVELWPGGSEARKSVLAEGTIANITGDGSHADYKFKLLGKNKSPMSGGFVYDFPRTKLMAWDLLYRVLQEARGNRNGDKP